MKTKVNFLIVLLITILVAPNLFSQENQRDKDVEGSKDFPLLTRFPGAVIEYYKELRFGLLTLPVSKYQPDDQSFQKTIKGEGKVTRIQYSVPKENNPYFVYKTYLNALTKANHDILFSAYNKDELGLDSYDFWFFLYGGESGLNPLADPARSPRGNNYCLITSKYVEEDRITYLLISAVDNNDWNFTLITIDAVEVQPLETGLVTAKFMQENIASRGHVAIYGIYFDTGKYDIKPESDKALQEIANFLKANTENKYYVVGHTDNVGEFQNNMTLSENRAKAVVEQLVSKYEVNETQLKAYGFSSLAPVSTNSTDTGRAKNRRVEIVEQ